MAGRKRTDNKGRVLRNGEQQRKQDGRYLYRYQDATGKTKTVYALTLQDLRKKEKEIERDVQDGIDTARGQMTLNQLFSVYMDTRADLRESTRSNYLRIWTYNVKDSIIGNMKVSNLKQMHIKQLYAELAKRGLAKNTIKLIHNLISPCMQMAVDSDIIRKNPAAGCKIEGGVKEKQSLTVEQQERLFQFVKNSNTYNVYLPFLTVAIGTGCRIGELTGLIWSDIDLKENMIHIRRQLQYLKIGNCTEFHIAPLKTDAGQRDIPMTKEVRTALTEQKKLLLMMGRSCKVEIDGCNNFVFITKTGAPYATNAVNSFLRNIVTTYNRDEKAAAEKRGQKSEPLPHISAHILRHTACTRMAEAGIDPKVLQAIMGHSNISVTMDVYNHTDAARLKNEMQKADGIIKYG